MSSRDTSLALPQTEMLVTALVGRPFAGIKRAGPLADLHLVLHEGGTVFVLDDQLARGVVASVRAELSGHRHDTDARELRAVGLHMARRVAVDSGLGFLRFARPKPMATGVSLALETCLVSDSAAPVSVIGALIVDYTRSETGWYPAAPPRQFAT
jgi:hypothetical protein